METTKEFSFADFQDDTPWADESDAFSELIIDNQIDGVRLRRLHSHRDDRGELTVLMTNLDDPSQQAGHVYHVLAAPGSVRAWVFHKRQHDRLAFVQGEFLVALYDMRPGSPTKGNLNVLEVGAANKVQLTIPPFVVHGCQNLGTAASAFVNMPDVAYDAANPDKSRLPVNHPTIPFRFE